MTAAAAVPWLCPRDETCPNVKAHDTYSAWKYGCRSGKSRAECRRYTKQVHAGLRPLAMLPVGPYARRMQALAARGWRNADIAEHSTMTRSHVASVMRADRATVTQATARAADAVFRKLWWRDGPSQWMRTYAAHRRWYAAACWDDIDNMDELPKLGTRRDRTIPGQWRGDTQDRRATIARLDAMGETLEQIGWAVGITPRSVSRHLAAIVAAEQPEEEAS